MTFPPRAIVAACPGLSVAERRDPPDLKRARTVDKGHGRIETRSLAVRTKLPARIGQNWPDITAFCRIERIREHKTWCTREVAYAITSLPLDKLDPAALLALSRDHWQIENCLFHVRDVTFKEDASRVRTGEAPKVMTALRDGALTLIRRLGQKPRDAREAFAASRRRVINLLLRS